MNAETKNVNSSFKILKEINSLSEFNIVHDEEYPIASKKIEIEKSTENIFNYQIDLEENLRNLSFKKLGFSKEFSMINQDFNFVIPDFGILTMKKKRESSILKGKLSEFFSKNLHQKSISFFQAVISVDITGLTTVFKSLPYNINSTFYGFGLFKFKVDDTDYNIFRIDNSEGNYLIIENLQPDKFSEFEHNLFLILKAIGLITGKYYNEEYYIFSSDDSTFEKTEFSKYNSTGESYLKPLKLIEPFDFRQFLESKGIKAEYLNLHFQPDIFSCLIEKMKKEPELERSVEIMLEGKENGSALMKSCSYHVALETLINLIYSKYKKQFKPIRETEEFKNLRKELQKIIDNKESGLDPNEYEILKKKIQYINSPFNSDKALKVFEILKINLPKNLLEALKTRNKFLHGKTPFSESEIKQNIRNLDLIADRIHLLCSIIILKYCGYKGLIKNFAGYKIAQQIYLEENTEIEDGESIYFQI